MTADEAGERIGASRTTARRYLEYLISSGELVADLNYGTVGRLSAVTNDRNYNFRLDNSHPNYLDVFCIHLYSFIDRYNISYC